MPCARCSPRPRRRYGSPPFWPCATSVIATPCRPFAIGSPPKRRRTSAAKSPKPSAALGDREALPLLTAALRDKATPDVVRDEALAAVELIATDEALKALLSLLQENTLGVEREPRIVEALGRFKSKEAVTALLKVLASPSPSVRKAAAEALGKSSDAKTAGDRCVGCSPTRFPTSVKRPLAHRRS